MIKNPNQIKVKTVQITIRYITLAILALTFTQCKVNSFSLSKNGLVAYYPFNGNAHDESGNNNNGAVYGANLTTDRHNKARKAYEFDGIDDHINTFSIFDYPYRTVSLWVYSYDIHGTSPHNHVAIAQDSPLNSYGLITVAFADGMLGLNAGGSNSAHFFKNVMENTWYHLALVRNGNQSLYYVNGKLVAQGVTGKLASTALPNPHFIIGSGRSTKYQFFSGKIDDIAIYNRALDQNEIRALYNSK